MLPSVVWLTACALLGIETCSHPLIIFVLLNCFKYYSALVGALRWARVQHSLPHQCLQVKDTVNSYNIESLGREYVRGTRQWLFAAANEWLEASLGHPFDTAADIPPHCRMFLLLAG